MSKRRRRLPRPSITWLVPWRRAVFRRVVPAARRWRERRRRLQARRLRARRLVQAGWGRRENRGAASELGAGVCSGLKQVFPGWYRFGNRGRGRRRAGSQGPNLSDRTSDPSRKGRPGLTSSASAGSKNRRNRHLARSGSSIVRVNPSPVQAFTPVDGGRCFDSDGTSTRTVLRLAGSTRPACSLRYQHVDPTVTRIGDSDR